MSLISGSSVTGAGGVAAYQIQRSLRFNSADSAYLNRTPASASNRKTFTWSGWVKRCNSATTNSLFAAYVDANNFFLIQFRENGDNGRFEVFNYSSTFDFRVETNALLRDPSAWYHIVVALDTTQATDSNRIKIYVNGTQQTLATTTYPTLNFDTDVNTTNAHNIGADGASGRYHNGYLTEVNFIDGQALTPSSFGETDSNTGVWKPKAYTGTYGTNGFYLNFSDNASTTTLGDDLSGNGNDWTTNNFSVTAGAGNDSLVDSPTSYGTDTGVGGSVRGNYCTWSAIDKASDCTLANGNLDVTTTNAPADNQVRGTIGVSSGKWYWEMLVNTTSNATMLGIVDASVTANTGVFPGTTAITYGYYGNNGNKYNNNTSSAYGNTYGSGDVIGCALDLDNGKIWWSKNGTWQASGDPAAGTNAAYTGVSGTKQPAAADVGGATAINVTANFGQRAFAYTAPSGFKALCTQNLPTPTIGATSTTQANDYFDVTLYTGTDATQSITNSGSMQPDFVWVKARNGAYNHYLYDVIRGSTNALRSSTTGAESQAGDSTLVLQSTGFQVTGTGLGLNSNGTTIVGWQWKGGGTGVTNTAGQITSTVSANTTSGFSIVTFTTDGTTKTVGHGLGAKPSLVIVKRRDGADAWIVITDILGSMQYGILNTTAAFTSIAYSAPTSTVFSYNDNNGNTQVAYCFAPVAGYSAFGSYTGDGSTDGPFVFTNMRPRYLMIKNYTGAGNGWIIIDTARSTYNQTALEIYANSSAAEASSSAYVDILSNGFKLKSGNSDTNNTGVGYIYMAFAESPFKYSLAR